jgi:hypothetical protein
MISESSSVHRPQPAGPAELDRLELTLRRVLDAHDAWRRRAEAAEFRVRELEAALEDVASGRLDPVSLADEARRLATTNRQLRERMDQAYAATERMLTRLQFVEEER